MTLPTPPVLSLFESLSQQQSSPEAVSVSPTTLKGVVASWIDSLVAQSCSALVWAKFPRGEAWQAELLRCVALLPDDRQVYALGSASDEGAVPLMSFLDGDTVLASSDRPPVMVQLKGDNPLRREFFFMVVSKEFCGLIVAQRVKVKRVSSELASESIVDGVDRQKMLMVSCAMGWAEVQPLLKVLESILETQTEEISDGTLAEMTIAGCLEKWRSQLTAWNLAEDIEAVAPVAAGLMNRQIYRQEDLWQQMIVHRKQSETADRLQRQNEVLVQTVRSKDEFLSTVGQELRTPLTNMKTAITLLNSPNIKPPQRLRYMALLVRECDRQTSLIRSLLDLVDLDQMGERETLQAIFLSDVVPGVVSTYQPLAEEKGVRLSYTIPNDLPPIACLVPWLRQIVVGLMHNGVKFTPPGGQVWVKAKRQGDFLQLEIKDTGIGISVQEIPRIFDRFYRVRQVSGMDLGGAGLGLTIVQQLLLRCGGSISVKSRPGEGSIFSVMMPIYVYRE
ncbi:MAG: histidine kinase [Alkalinema sp. CAN_BIN05]|nr:histidine kinase [Alkalinema sp. CAN_BIN05]